jgi:hypothetical protein
MARPIKPIQINDFTGGLNLDVDQFSLADNEFPDCLNVVIQPNGGVRARKGWEPWGASSTGAAAQGSLFFFLSSTDVRQVLIARGTDHKVLWSNGGPWTDIGLTCGATPHEAAFATWLTHVYIACGKANVGQKWNGTTRTALTASGSSGSNWQNDYDTPTGTHMPKAEFAAVHADRLWVAYTNEDSTDRPQRVRYSHFNAPESWHEEDYIDLPRGGGAVTALLPFQDCLLVFKERQVWAIYGYEDTSFQPVLLTAQVGAPHQNMVSANEQRVYFYDRRVGLYSWDGRRFVDRFEKLRTAIEQGWVGPGLNRVSVSVLDREVWVTLPFSRLGDATDVPWIVFVYDESITKDGAWTAFTGKEGYAPRRCITFIDSSGVKWRLGCTGSHWVINLAARHDTKDNNGDGELKPFDSYLHTRWIDVGVWGQKAQHRAPDFILSDLDIDATLQVWAFADYEEANPARTFTLDTQASVGTPLVWNVGLWGTGTWGKRPAGSLIVRGKSLGTMRAVKLAIGTSIGNMGGAGAEARSEAGSPWGLNGIVFKAVPRKLR